MTLTELHNVTPKGPAKMTQEIVKAEQGNEAITNTFYSSLTGDTQEARLELFDLVSAAAGLDDNINTPMNVTDVVIQKIAVVDEETGELSDRKRIVLITEDGKSYATTSLGVETALNNLINIVGAPTWNPPLALMATKQQGRNGYKFTTLVRAPKK